MRDITTTKKEKTLQNQYDGMANTFPDYTPEQIKLMHNTVAKDTTINEFWLFLNIASKQDLNPFTKEIWCYKDKKGNLIIFASRDGFLKKAQENPKFLGVRSVEVRESDEFEIDVPNNKITHKVKSLSNKERGALTGAYAIAFVKDREPVIELATFSTYNKGYNTWKTHPEEMIKKVAETHALKKAFGISGIYAEEEFGFGNGSTRGESTPEPLPGQIEQIEATGVKDNAVYKAVAEKIEKAKTEYATTKIKKDLAKQLELGLITAEQQEELMKAVLKKEKEITK